MNIKSNVDQPSGDRDCTRENLPLPDSVAVVGFIRTWIENAMRTHIRRTMRADANTHAECAKNCEGSMLWVCSGKGGKQIHTSTITSHALKWQKMIRYNVEYRTNGDEYSTSRTVQFMGVVKLNPTKIVIMENKAERRQPEYSWGKVRSTSVTRIWRRLIELTHIDQR